MTEFDDSAIRARFAPIHDLPVPPGDLPGIRRRLRRHRRQRVVAGLGAAGVLVGAATVGIANNGGNGDGQNLTATAATNDQSSSTTEASPPSAPSSTTTVQRQPRVVVVNAGADCGDAGSVLQRLAAAGYDVSGGARNSTAPYVSTPPAIVFADAANRAAATDVAARLGLDEDSVRDDLAGQFVDPAADFDIAVVLGTTWPIEPTGEC